MALYNFLVRENYTNHLWNTGCHLHNTRVHLWYPENDTQVVVIFLNIALYKLMTGLLGYCILVHNQYNTF